MTSWGHHKLIVACIYTMLLALVLHIRVSQADHERTCDFQSRPHRNGRCGSALSNLVSDLCRTFGENYLSSNIKKRHAERRIDENLRDIMLNKKDAFSYLVKRETTGTITCECCYHACRMEELLQYCDVPSSNNRGTRSVGSNHINHLTR